MKINIIREFIRLSETKNYTRTAEELYISQSVLSRHISQLEEELGVQLISRSRSSFELTEAGEAACQAFRRMLEEYQDLLTRLSDLTQQKSGEIHVGVLYYDYSGYVAEIREAFKEHYPNIHLHLHSYQPEQIETDLLKGEIDAAFLYGVRTLRRDDISVHPFLKIPLSIMYDRSHRLAAVQELKVKDLDGEKILWPSSHLELSQTGNIISGMFAKSGVRMKEYISFSNFDDVPFLLKDTGAIYISPMANQKAYPDSVECRHLETEKLSMDISLVWRRDSRNPAIRSLTNTLRIIYA